MHAISAVIITYNEENNIGRCIESLKRVADEIIVLDSYSADGTVTIAKQLGAIVHQHIFRGYIDQKNAALRLASNNYILSLDADEALDDILTSSILAAKRTLHFRAYCMSRMTCYCGQFIRHGLWYPDRKIRLFDRRIVKWGGLNPHDKIILDPAYKVRQLKGNLLHYSFNTPEDLVWQNNRHSSIAALSMYAIGKKSSLFKMIIRPVWAFFNGYILRKGFLDGANGFAIAIQTSNQVFLKYHKLHKLQKEKRQSPKKNIRPIIAKTKNMTADG